MLRPAPIICLCALLLTACKPSTMLRPDTPAETSTPAAPTTLDEAVFKSGVWTDDLGNTWRIDVSGTHVRGIAEQGGLEGLMITGAARNGVLNYTIEASDVGGMGLGKAVLVDDGHAYFSVSGSLSGHGLFHFEHASGTRDACVARSPRDLRPPPLPPVDTPKNSQGD